jgi:hypothetical protein
MNPAKNVSRTLPQFPLPGSVTDAVFIRLLGPRIYQSLKSGYGWLKHEKNDRTSLPVSRRLQMWRHGFYAESALFYDLPHNDARDYLSDYTRVARCQEINSYNDFFSHKLVLRSFLLAMGFRQAETLALVFEGRILSHPFGGTAEHIGPEELMHRLLASGRRYIVKPENGACGEDVFLLEQRGGQLLHRRGREATPFDLGTLLRESGNDPEARMTLIEERLEQGPFWQRLFPDSTNTIRVLTLWAPGEPAPFIARAVQRIGRADTIPTDDWSGGGISVSIDLASGTLGQGRLHPFKSKQSTEKSVTRHPDTGTEITGTVLPGWDRIQDTVLRAAASLPFNRMAGWDVLVTSDGEPVIIGANGDSDINLLQVHGGLLADPRVRRFYQQLGALGRH